jgi:hypothetical protein
MVVCVLMTRVGGEPADPGQRLEIPLANFARMELLHDPGDAPARQRERRGPKERDIPDGTRQIEEWFGLNPIRRWCEQNQTSQDTLAALCGVSVVSIRHWIAGRSLKPQHRRVLAAALGMSGAEFESQWDAWMARRPGTR